LDYCRAKDLSVSTVNHLKERRSHKQAELYFVETALKCEKMGIAMPELPRKKTLPRLTNFLYLRGSLTFYLNF